MFAVKLHSGEGNYFENCVAEYNSDDGWDCYAAHGAVTLVNCQANYNGYCDGIYGDGNGFKMGGVDNKHQERQLTLILLTISLLDVQLRETMLMVSIETTRVVL